MEVLRFPISLSGFIVLYNLVVLLTKLAVLSHDFQVSLDAASSTWL